jgi:hypothetical protein
MSDDRSPPRPSSTIEPFPLALSLGAPPLIWHLTSVLCHLSGGGERIRTADPLLAKQVLSQLSYAPRSQEAKPASLRFPDSGFWYLASVRRDAQTAARQGRM